MVGRASGAGGRDRDRDRAGNVPQHPASPPPLPPRPAADARTPPQPQVPAAHSHAQLPPLPESPVAPSHPAATPNIASVLRSSTLKPTTPSDNPSSRPQPTIRAVTPEPLDQHRLVAQNPPDAGDLASSSIAPTGRAFVPRSPQSSPRSVPAGTAMSHQGNAGSRRQGVVFSDDIADTFDNTTNPTPRAQAFRPRTHTMDGASPFREPLGATPSAEARARVGSFSSTGTTDGGSRLASVLHGTAMDTLNFAHAPVNRSTEVHVPPTSVQAGGLTTSSSTASVSSVLGPGLGSPSLSHSTPTFSKDKKSSSRRLIKRASARPTSPLISALPSVDSLILPIPTDDANQIIMLMKSLCGKMRGDIEYRGLSEDTWSKGICYIEEEKGSLMFNSGEQSLFHTAIIPDLRGCRVLPVEQPDMDDKCLELFNAQSSINIVMRPSNDEEVHLWLAALLCWQQLRPTPGTLAALAPKVPGARSATTPLSTPDTGKRRTSAKAREGTIIKVGKVMLWDKGTTTSPQSVMKRSSTRDLQSVQSSWRRVSCILQGNGDFKLMTENDVTVLSVIEIGQLARCAIQQLDKSVLDEEYCIAIFPTYAPSSTHLSVYRPVYIALDSRVAFEVWFVLLRAFTVPHILSFVVNSDDTNADSCSSQSFESSDVSPTQESPTQKGPELERESDAPSSKRQLFRREKSLTIRVTEAKIKPSTPPDGSHEPPPRPHDRRHENRDPSIGNYLAEVLIDGEVRSRTATKSDTRNPFWREDSEFMDLPAVLPSLSVILKRVDGSDTYTHQLQMSLGLPKSGNLREVVNGSVDILLADLETGIDHERWFPIHDDTHSTVGSMLLKIHYEEFAVLAGEDYKELSDMIHDFSTGLTLQIAELMTTHLRRLSELFVNIFQVSGSVGEWLMALVEDEIDGIGNHNSVKTTRFSRRLRSNDSAESTSDRDQQARDVSKSLQGEANLLFRGNTLLTQSFEFHMRRLGKEYLEEILLDKIFEINEINADYEVDPSRIQPGQDINKHWEHLLSLTTELWDGIATSANRIPSELRHIFKYIRVVAEDRYGDYLKTVSYTSVSGFLFLRFICPAILNPKLSGLLRDHPRPRAQRTLTLIAKSLMALANLSAVGNKQAWMEPMNKLMGSQRNTLMNFIDAVCSVPAEKPNATVLPPASYSTPITIMGRLSESAREGFPSLPYLIDHPRSFAALVKLWMDEHPPTAPSSKVYKGALRDFYALCCRIQAKSEDYSARAAAIRSAELTEDAQPAEGALSERLERATLADTINFSYGNNTAWMDHEDAGGTASNFDVLRASHNRSGPLVPPGSSGSEMEEQWGREQKGRQMSFGSFSVHGADIGGSIKGMRNNKHARKFFSGIISRKPRTASPDHVDDAEALAQDREQEREHRDKRWDRFFDGDRDRDRDADRGRDNPREQARQREREEREKAREKEKEKERERERDKQEKARKAKEKAAQKEKEKEREKEREREKQAKKEKEKEKEREKEREKEKERQHKRAGSKDNKHSSKKDKPDKADKKSVGLSEPRSPSDSSSSLPVFEKRLQTVLQDDGRPQKSTGAFELTPPLTGQRGKYVPKLAPQDPTTAFFESIRSKNRGGQAGGGNEGMFGGHHHAFGGPVMTPASQMTTRPSFTVDTDQSIRRLQESYSGRARDLYGEAMMRMDGVQQALEGELASMAQEAEAFLGLAADKHAQLNRPPEEWVVKIQTREGAAGPETSGSRMTTKAKVTTTQKDERVVDRIATIREAADALKGDLAQLWQQWAAAQAEAKAVLAEMAASMADQGGSSAKGKDGSKGSRDGSDEIMARAEEELEAAAAAAVKEMKENEKTFKKLIYNEEVKVAQSMLSRQSKYD